MLEENRMLPEEEAMDAPAPEAEAEDVAAQMAALRAELEARFEQMLSEAVRVSGLSAEDRAAYAADQREADLERRERAVERKEWRAEAQALLAKRGLPGELADALSYESYPAMLSAVDSVEAAFRAAVQRAVEDRLKGETPAAGASAQGVDADQLDDADYYRMMLK